YGKHYKPVGELQRNAGRVRVGAMGYLLDDSATRYGGVLRAPIKYLGPHRHAAPGFVRMANERLEWNPETGVFYRNPEDPTARDSASVNSGVINYLNKFGRNSQYKALDPVGELYYEGLRYLQGLQPTPEAVSDINDSMRDGFPVHASWNDPLLASCQRNYILAIADVNTHWDRYIPGNTRTTFGKNQNANDPARPLEPAVPGKTPALDVRTWTRKVGELEADAGGTFGNPAPRAHLAGLDTLDTGSGGHGTYYMAGLAYWANTQDIRVDKPARVQTFAIDVDEGGNGIVDGNTRGLKPRDSQLYLAAKYGGFRDRNGDGNPFKTIGPDGKPVHDPYGEWDNGEGVPANYFLAGQPREMIDAIRSVFAGISASSGTLSGVSLSTGRIGSDGLYIYQPGFDPLRWSGTLRKLKLSLDDDGGVRVSDAAEWEAGAVLTGTANKASVPDANQRRIFAGSGSGAGFKTVPFLWDSLDTAQRQALNRSSSDGAEDGLGAARVAYLRGTRNQELGRPNGMFRQRDSLLGDIVNSNPVHVGPPSGNAHGPGYAEFREKYKSRVPAVYIGANDGMMHAFSAADGRELFAYVPAALVPQLAQLTDPAYAHRPFVDGGLSVAEARVGDEWKTVLLGAMGGGAQGVFALDVSDPGNFAAGAGALFEFTDADDPDIGNVMGAPAIARLRVGSKDGVTQYKYFAIVASGLNNYVPDGEGRHNSDAAGALFLLALDKPAGVAWKAGVNYYKVRLPAADKTKPNGLSQPALVAGADAAVHTVYVGDLQGQMWRIRLGTNPATLAGPGAATPIFTAAHEGKIQPVTAQPRVAFAPGGYVVLFGTGKFIEAADAAPGGYEVQSFYAVLDTLAPGYHASRSDLVARSLTPSADGGYQVTGDPVTYGNAAGSRKGWYIDFPDSDKSGERIVTNPVVLNGYVFFNSLIPGSDPCAAGGGRSYAVGTLSGMPAQGRTIGHLSQVGMLSAPVVLESAVKRGARDAIGGRIVERRHQVVNFGTGGARGMGAPADNGSGAVTLRAGRLSWREVLNWQELSNAGKK
ncbi:MAG TPA: PilC/PilY family type IV pilus protein, partial [Noviherbaspirillum sp.]|nr:PilC/PilY family type IV pilus protein [Noviherbaspirillum sp.]